jgi:hypothetical protein
MKNEIMHKLHAAHMGINSTLRIARQLVYWPGILKEVKEYVASCPTCSQYPDQQPEEPLMLTEIPEHPWDKVGCDLFMIHGRDYLVTADYYSNFFEVDHLQSATAEMVVTRLKHHFARHGIPSCVVSDGGPQFTAQTFKQFAEDWNFEHRVTSPEHAKSNGAAEAAVKVAKRIMRKYAAAREDPPYIGLLMHRNTPTEGGGTSPSQRLFNRPTKTLLPRAGKKSSITRP